MEHFRKIGLRETAGDETRSDRLMAGMQLTLKDAIGKIGQYVMYSKNY